MDDYEFALAFTLPGGLGDVDELIDRLGFAGCDDARVRVDAWGRLELDFVREAADAFTALSSALADVRRAEPGLRLVEASPDYVGLSDIADVLKISRQAVRKLLLTGDMPPPAPVHEGRPSIWRLARILAWLREEKGYPVPRSLQETARLTMQVNLALEARDADSATRWALIEYLD